MHHDVYFVVANRDRAWTMACHVLNDEITRMYYALLIKKIMKLTVTIPCEKNGTLSIQTGISSPATVSSI